MYRVCDTIPAKARRCEKTPHHLPQLSHWTEAPTQPALRHRGNSSEHHVIMVSPPVNSYLFSKFLSKERKVDYSQYGLEISYQRLREWWTAERRACLQRLDSSKRTSLCFISWADLHLMPTLCWAWQWSGRHLWSVSDFIAVCDSVRQRVATSHRIYWNIKL